MLLKKNSIIYLSSLALRAVVIKKMKNQFSLDRNGVYRKFYDGTNPKSFALLNKYVRILLQTT